MAKLLVFINSIILFVTSILGVSFTPTGYKLDGNKLATEVKNVTEARIEAGTLTGAHVLVMQNGETVLNQTYGLDGAEGSDLKDDATYRIASMTKPITALALLIEHDRGNLNIYDEVSAYLPEFKEMSVAVKDANGNITGTEKATSSIKVYQLVSHASGIRDIAVNNIPNLDYSLKNVASYIATQPLNFNPGSKTEYSTAAFDVASRIIEITSGMEFEQYLKANIFDKLGMTDTTFEPDESQWARLVKVHNLVDGKVVNAATFPLCVFGNFPVTYHAAGAGLMSTTSDYSKFAQMLLNGGVGDNGQRILSEDTLKLMYTPIEDDKGTGTTKWGLGVIVRVKPGADVPVGSYGWSGAYGSHFWVDPTNRITAVYMKNSAYDGGAGNKSATEFSATLMNCFTVFRLS